MALDVYFREDIENAVRAALVDADVYHPDYARALLKVALAFGIEACADLAAVAYGDAAVEVRRSEAIPRVIER